MNGQDKPNYHRAYAFPVAQDSGTNWNGLTKLDYFAAAALQGLMSREGTNYLPHEAIAATAYAIAEAMLMEREK